MNHAGFRNSRTAVWPVVLLLAATSAQHAHGGNDSGLIPWARGEVRSVEDDSLLYREHHRAASPDAQLPARVEYRSAEGRLLAEKMLDYSVSETAPALEFIDHRRDVRITTRYPGEGDSNRIEMIYHPPGDSAPERERFDTQNLIVDAGFDPYVRRHWEPLMEGERIVASFLVPSRNDTVRVAVSRVAAGDCETTITDLHCFRVQPAGILRFLSWFTEPTYLGDRADPRRLMFYHGRASLPDEDSDPRQVRIHYRYDAL